MSAADDPPVVLYVVSRFPSATETFVVNEWLALGGRFRMALAALRRSAEPPLHEASRRAMERVRFLDAPDRSLIGAHLSWLARGPGAYLSTLTGVLRGALRLSPRGAAKEAIVFLRAVPLAGAAAREGVAHVHAHFANHPATAAWVVHRLTGIPFSFTAHANDLFVRPAAVRRKAADARFVVAISEYNRRLLPSARQVEVIHCGVDLERHPWRGLEGRDRDRVLCVASLTAKKGHAHLLDALALLTRRRPRVVLELVGDGPERERILQRARELGLADRVRLLGARSAAEVSARLAEARVFALASMRMPSGRMDGIPVALMEAMAGGLPVVATRISGVPELVEDGVTGLLVEPGDAEGLAAAMARALEDDALAAALAGRARARVERSFDLEREAQRLGDLFAESIAG